MSTSESVSALTQESIEQMLSNRARVFHGGPRRSLRMIRVREGLIYAALLACGIFSLLVTIAIIIVLSVEMRAFFADETVTLKNFLGSTEWSPLLGKEKSYGIWGLVCGTMLVTCIAMLIALPLGLVTAIYLSEYAPRKARNLLKPALEVLAGVPTVVYGFFALTTITPILQWLHEGFNVYNATSAGIAVGILCFPTVCSLAEDALQAVPRALREAGYGLGGTRFDVSTKVIVPAAMSGIISAFLLAIARAIGETMVVALAAGSRAQFTVDPRDEVQTMTGFMVQMASGDVSNQDVSYYAMYAVAFTLFLLTLSLTMIGNIISRRYRETYE